MLEFLLNALGTVTVLIVFLVCIPFLYKLCRFAFKNWSEMLGTIKDDIEHLMTLWNQRKHPFQLKEEKE